MEICDTVSQNKLNTETRILPLLRAFVNIFSETVIILVAENTNFIREIEVNTKDVTRENEFTRISTFTFII